MIRCQAIAKRPLSILSAAPEIFAAGPFSVYKTQHRLHCCQVLAGKPLVRHILPGPGNGQVVNHSTSRAISASNPDTSYFKNVIKRLGWGSSSKSKLKFSSYYLYESVADQLNYADFFDQFGMPNTFNSWFLVTELHVWMLLVRSMAQGAEKNEDGRFMRNTIVEAMWTDVSSRAKKLGAHNPSRVRQQTEILSHQFQAALINYDEGLQGDDKTLAGALWRRFFVKEEACDLEKIELLVRYVRAQAEMLDRMAAEEFVVKPKVQWVTLAKLQQ